MHTWNYTPGHAFTLSLAADARLSPTDYANDQIWQLNFGGSDPPAISVETTFGLRARLCRIFPRFSYNGHVVTDPADFSHPINIQRYCPNYICLSFNPFSSINVRLEYWVPGSQAIACRTKLTNTGHETCLLELEWAEVLLPIDEGMRMAVSEIDMATILAGRTADLAPVLFLTGGAQSGKSPYPSLNLSCSIPAKGEKEAVWVHASLDNTNASYEFTKKILDRNWDGEFAHLLRINSASIDIKTGNKDWDNAFFLSQVLANQMLIGPTHYCQTLSLIATRKPDQGFSRLKNGSDYNHLWNGQSLIDIYHLSNILLPGAPELVQGLVENFLATQTSEGEIDCRPGPGGQRTHLLATPMLAEIILQIYQYTGNIQYLRTVFPNLLAFFLSWFSPSHDRDCDQFPEWDQAIQTGYEELPLFSQHHSWSCGVDISVVESPDLASYLFRECRCLLSIAKIIGNDDVTAQLTAISNQLQQALEESWSDEQASYLYRDRDSHTSTGVENLGSCHGPGIIAVQRGFPQPIRPIIQIMTRREVTHPAQIFIHGTGTSGAHRVENITSRQVHWQLERGYITSQYSYSSIERIEINGIRAVDTVLIQAVNLNILDQSLLLPLWAGIPSSDKAKVLINLTIMNKKKFLAPFGLRTWVELPGQDGYPEDYIGLHLPWTVLALKGMVKYGERKKAAEVFSRFMKAVVQAIGREMKLYQSYHSETGKPQGTSNTLLSLVPVGLFLEILGVNIISPTIVEVSGSNPFTWPVTVRYRGMTIVKQEKKTLVIFPSGESTTVDHDQFRRLSCAYTTSQENYP